MYWVSTIIRLFSVVIFIQQLYKISSEENTISTLENSVVTQLVVKDITWHSTYISLCFHQKCILPHFSVLCYCCLGHAKNVCQWSDFNKYIPQIYQIPSSLQIPQMYILQPIINHWRMCSKGYCTQFVFVHVFCSTSSNIGLCCLNPAPTAHRFSTYKFCVVPKLWCYFLVTGKGLQDTKIGMYNNMNYFWNGETLTTLITN